MGDRSSIAIEQGDGSRIYLYSHWGGSEAIQHVLHGVGSGRAHDTAYLARVIFSRMVRNEIDEETGYGITTERVGDEYPLLTIDPDEGTVTIEGRNKPVPYDIFIKAAERLEPDGTEGDYTRLIKCVEEEED